MHLPLELVPGSRAKYAAVRITRATGAHEIFCITDDESHALDMTGAPNEYVLKLDASGGPYSQSGGQ